MHVSPTPQKLTIGIAGASGFVGRSLISKLTDRHHVIGLTRRASMPPIQGVTCLAGCDVAVYLVHSMLPAARLTQGRFEDLDLLIADNFSRAAEQCGLKKIVYLGGLIPEGELSRHLRSRNEVEIALADHNVPCITLRAGLVVGANGSSFEMMRKLVQRLPVMICPKWTTTRSQPIALVDVVKIIAKVVDDFELPAGAYDIGGKNVLTYIDMMNQTAAALGKRRFFAPVGVFSPKLSRLWVRLVTGAPRQLIGPLVESLRHTMVARDNALFDRYNLQPMPFAQALRDAVTAQEQPKKNLLASLGKRFTHRITSKQLLNTVYSVQRLPLPSGKNAQWVANRYASWLIDFLFPLVRVRQDADGSLELMLQLGFKHWSVCLLRLQCSADKSSANRQLFFIDGGILLSSQAMGQGRFEFREVLGRTCVMAAIFDFVPALPWWLYKTSQALVHLAVMWAFKNALEKELPHSGLAPKDPQS